MGDLVTYDDGSTVPSAGPIGLVPAPVPDPVGRALVPTGDRHPVVPAPPLRSHRLVVGLLAAALLAATGVGAALVVSGSGSTGTRTAGASGARGDLAGSATDSASARSADFTVSVTESRPGTTSSLMAGHGAIDLSRDVGQLSATAPALSSMIGGGSDGSLTVISDGGALYVKVPVLSSFTGKSWVEASFGAPSRSGPAPAGSGSLSSLADPSGLLGLVGSLDGTVTKVGMVRLGGSPMTEYRSILSVADLEAKLTHRTNPPAAVRATARALEALGVPTVPFTAWVGQDGLVHQVSVSLSAKHATLGGLIGLAVPSLAGSGASASGTQIAVTVGLSHYGQPVAIAVPPPSEVTKLGDIASAVHGAVTKVGGLLSGVARRV
jgi:hypothetical protein